MTNEIEKPKRYKDAVEKIEKAVKKVPSTSSIGSFKTKGSIFPCNNHNVTGDEVNETLVIPLQSTIIGQNNYTH